MKSPLASTTTTTTTTFQTTSSPKNTRMEENGSRSFTRLFSSLFGRENGNNDNGGGGNDGKDDESLISNSLDALVNATLVEDRRQAMDFLVKVSKTKANLLYKEMEDWTLILDQYLTTLDDPNMTQSILDLIINLTAENKQSNNNNPSFQPSQNQNNFLILPYELVLFCKNNKNNDTIDTIDTSTLISDGVGGDERSSDLLSIPGIHKILLEPFLVQDDMKSSFIKTPTPLLFTLLQILLQLLISNEWSLVQNILLEFTSTNPPIMVLNSMITWLSHERRPLIKDLLMEFFLNIESPIFSGLSYGNGLLSCLIDDSYTTTTIGDDDHCFNLKLLKKSLLSYTAMSSFCKDAILMAKFGKILRLKNKRTFSFALEILLMMLDPLSPMLKDTQQNLVSGPCRLLAPLLDAIFSSKVLIDMSFQVLTALIYGNQAILDIILRQEIVLSSLKRGKFAFVLMELLLENNSNPEIYSIPLLSLFEDGILQHSEMATSFLIILLTKKAIPFFEATFSPKMEICCIRILRFLTILVLSDGITRSLLLQSNVPLTIGATSNDTAAYESPPIYSEEEGEGGREGEEGRSPLIVKGTPFLKAILSSLQFCLEESLLRDKEWDIYSLAYMRLLISLMDSQISSSLIEWDDSMLLQRLLLVVNPLLQKNNYKILPPSSWEDDVGMIGAILLVSLSFYRSDIYDILLENLNVELIINRWIRRVLLLSSNSKEVILWKEYCKTFFDKFVGNNCNTNGNVVDNLMVNVRIEKTKLFINDIAYRTDLSLFSEEIPMEKGKNISNNNNSCNNIDKEVNSMGAVVQEETQQHHKQKTNNTSSLHERGILSYIGAIKQQNVPSKETYDV